MKIPYLSGWVQLNIKFQNDNQPNNIIVTDQWTGF